MEKQDRSIFALVPLFILTALLPVLSAGCPAVSGTAAIDDYWPIKEAESWSWLVCDDDAPGEAQVISMYVAAQMSGYEGTAWRCTGEGLDLLLEILAGADGKRLELADGADLYLMLVDGSYYAAASQEGLEGPVEDLWRLPLPEDLTPRIEQEDGRWLAYAEGSLSTYLPLGGFGLDDFGVGEQADCIVVFPSEDGWQWGEPVLILGPDLGAVSVKGAGRRLLLQEAVVFPDKEDCPLCELLGS